jgi:hypothetical protein
MLAIVGWWSGSGSGRGSGSSGHNTRASGRDARWTVLAHGYQARESRGSGVKRCSVGCAKACHFWVVDEISKAIVSLAIVRW